MRIDHGPGYRLYYVSRGISVVVFLIGGSKKSQTKDIERAIQLANLL